jgi:ketosteroid isomerase-like protein
METEATSTGWKKTKMDVENMLRDFCSAVEQHDGQRLAQLFCEDGVYHDVFYGAFAGRERIAELIDVWFYKDADDFRWDMVDPVFDGQTLYTRYLFSFRSLLPEARHARAMFEGVSLMKIRDSRIAEYREIANVAPGLVDMNFAPERIAKIVTRQGNELKRRPEMARHLT